MRNFAKNRRLEGDSFAKERSMAAVNGTHIVPVAVATSHSLVASPKSSSEKI